MDNATETRRRISYARICVEVDATKLLIEDFIIDVPDPRNPDHVCDEISIRVEYQWKPLICDYCHVFGHSIEKYFHSAKQGTDPKETKNSSKSTTSQV